MQDKELQLSYWLVSSRPRIRTAGFVLFCVFDIAMLLVVVFLGIRYFSSAESHEAIIASLVDNRIPYSTHQAALTPEELLVSKTAILSGTGGNYTLVAMVMNPSDRWAVLSADYDFLLDQDVVAEGTTSFFPGEERAVASFHVELARVSAASALRVAFSNIRWQRVLEPGDLPDVRLSVTNPAYRVLSSVPGNQLSQVTATVRNDSVEPVASAAVTALLMNGGDIVGVGRLVLTDLEGQEERPVDIRFFQAITTTNVQVTASVDLHDEPAAP